MKITTSIQVYLSEIGVDKLKNHCMTDIKRLFFLASIFFLTYGNVIGQGFLQQIDFGEPADYERLQPVELFQTADQNQDIRSQIEQVVSRADLLEVNESMRGDFLNFDVDRAVVNLPLRGDQLELWLIKSPIVKQGSEVFAASDRNTPIETYELKCYWGVVKGAPGSFVSFTVSPTEIMAFITIDDEDYTLGKMEGEGDMHILYRNNDLLVTSDFDCAVEDAIHDKSEHRIEGGGGERDENNCVNMYVEANHNIYQDKGTVAATSNYILGLFNQVGILYANELINFSVQELVVWDVPSPYNGPGSGDYLDQFLIEHGSVPNGDLAHLVGYGGGGGVAYLYGICNPSYGFGYSGINSGYQNVPTYSWSVMVVTHEIGHNLGSRHTHNCFWNGSGNPAIDGCGPEAGYSEGCEGPIPVTGTIMSYCHLVSGVGISLAEGFGPQPGDLIRQSVHNASCLGDCISIEECQAPYGITASNIDANSIELSWDQSGSVTLWNIEYGPAGFTPVGTPTISDVGNPYTVSGLDPGTDYDFYISANCSDIDQSGWEGPASFTTLELCPAPENASAINITTSSVELSWSQPGAANSWDLEYGIAGFTPTGTPSNTGVTNPYEVTGLTGGASYDFYIRANCAGTEQSNWAGPFTFTVLCDGNYSIPWTETFEDNSPSRSCWTQVVETGQPGGNSFWTFQSGSSDGTIQSAYEGILNAQFVSQSPSMSGSPVTKLISPELDLSGYDLIELSFFYGQEVWSGDQNELKVYYKSAAQDPWVELAHFTESVSEWTQVVLPLENFSSSYRIAFEGINNWGHANVVDEVSVRPIPFSNIEETACDSITLNEETYYESGFYTQTLTSAAGGDSLLYISLTINASTSAQLNESACDEFVLNGSTYATSGLYEQILTNAAGCDSTITLNLTITGQTDQCGECIAGGVSDPDWNQSCADCNGDPNGTAFTDDCGNCAGGNTGVTACVQDCNNEWGGTAYIDNCGQCVEGSTGNTPCVQDCNGDSGGTAFIDDCDNCVGGNTGETACVQDCNNDWGGTAYLDNCGQCVEGATGVLPCIQDCSGEWGGTAFTDDCDQCVGGNTGLTPCAPCNLDITGSAEPADPGFANGTATATPLNGLEPYTYQWDDPFMQTTASAVGLFPGTYTCLVTDANNCEGEVSVDVNVMSLYATELNPNYCNTEGYVLSDFIAADYVSNATAYRWEFTPVGGSPLPVYTRYAANQWIRLQWVSGIQLGTTYEVRVKVRVGGVWGEYGAMCNITTTSDLPTTQVLPNYTPTNQNGVAYALCDFVVATNISGASNYRWRFDPDSDPNNGNELIYTRGTGNSSVRLSWVNDIQPGTTYNVAVEVNLSGEWSGYSTILPVQLAAVSNNVVVRTEYCNQTYAPNGIIHAENICAADYYRFRFIPTVSGAIRQKVSSSYVLLMGTINPPLTPGTYLVEVRAQQNGVLGSFGPSCPITISGPSPQGLEPPVEGLPEYYGKAGVFPNPNNGNSVRLDLQGVEDGAHEASILLYDSHGKQMQVEAFDFIGTSFNDMLNFKAPLKPGVYLMQIVIDQKAFATERIVVH